MIVPIVKVPNEILTRKSESISEITPEISQLAKDMVETMVHNAGIGLSAPQIGQSLRIIVVTIKDTPVIMYNPIILAKSPVKKSENEGCLSFEKGVQYKVKRPAAVKIKYRNEQGKMTYAYLQDMDARIFMHEFGHLEGLTMDREGELAT